MNMRLMPSALALSAALVGICTASAFELEQELVVGKYRGTTALSGFPVLVRISAARIPGFAYSQFKLANGGDLAFETPEGVACPHEIESWDSSGESLVWVRLPVLKGKTTQLVMRWGDASATPPATSRDVWCDSAGGFYAGVWHFSETLTPATAATTSSADSAKYDAALDLKATPVQRGDKVFITDMVSTNGIVGNARVNQTVATGYYAQNNNGGNSLHVASYDTLALGSTFTISGWFRRYASSNYPGFVNRDTNFVTADSWSCFGYLTEDSQVGYRYRTNQSQNYYYNTIPDGKKLSDHWTHVVVVYDGTKSSFYLDGVLMREDATIAGYGDNGKDLVFGLWYTALAGAYDEIRLHSDPVAKDWAQAEYDSIADADYVTAVVTPARYVSVGTGSDVTGDGTSEKPWATIGHAVAEAAEGDEIRIAAGTYAENVVLSTADLTLRGGYATDWTRDLAVNRAVVKPADATKPCVLADGVIPVTLRGLTLTGGTYGLQTTNGCSDIVAEQLIVTNCTAGGLKLAGGSASAVYGIRNSYLANNGGWGLSVGAPQGSFCRIANTTIAGNAAGGITCGDTQVVLRNAVIDGQTSGPGVSVGQYGICETLDSCIWNGSLSAFQFWTSADWDYWMYNVNPQIRQNAGTLRVDARLAADGTLSADSPCLRTGDAAVTDDMLERRDVYGRVWGATPDMGCFKSSFEPTGTAVFADVYVAVDGDDANAGTGAAVPMQSLALGVRRVAPGGTLHIGPGRFAGPVILDRPGMRLAGSGADETEVFVTDSRESAVVVCATGVVVRAVATSGGFIGVQLVGDGTGVEVADCVLRNSTRGFSSVASLQSSAAGTVRLRASVFTNDYTHAIQFFHNDVIGENLLIVRNGRQDAQSKVYSVAVMSGDNSSEGTRSIWLYNCTVADNLGTALYTGRSYASTKLTHNRYFVNCIVSGNSKFGYNSNDADGTYGHFLNCLVYGNGTDFGQTVESNVNPVAGPVRFDTRPRRLYRLTNGSPAVGSGVDVTTLGGAMTSFDDDLVHDRRQAWDLGCYAFNPVGFLLMVR